MLLIPFNWLEFALDDASNPFQVVWIWI